MRMRTIKRSPVSRHSTAKMQTLIQGIHIIPTEDAAWEVRTLGSKPLKKRFTAKNEALKFAYSIKRKASSEILLHSNGRDEGSLQGVSILRRGTSDNGEVEYEESQLH